MSNRTDGQRVETITHVAAAVLRSAAFPVFLCVGAASMIVLLAIVSADPVLLATVLILLMHLAAGLLGGFLIHECAHWAVMKHCSGIREVLVSQAIFRFSLTPRGIVSGPQIVAIALAGPLAAGAVGVGLMITIPQFQLHFWYLIHLVFLVPVFADGRSLLVGISRWSSTVDV